MLFILTWLPHLLTVCSFFCWLRFLCEHFDITWLWESWVPDNIWFCLFFCNDHFLDDTQYARIHPLTQNSKSEFLMIRKMTVCPRSLSPSLPVFILWGDAVCFWLHSEAAAVLGLDIQTGWWKTAMFGSGVADISLFESKFGEWWLSRFMSQHHLQLPKPNHTSTAVVRWKTEIKMKLKMK